MVLNKFPLLLYITKRAFGISLSLFHLAHKSSFFSVERFLYAEQDLGVAHILLNY